MRSGRRSRRPIEARSSPAEGREPVLRVAVVGVSTDPSRAACATTRRCSPGARASAARRARCTGSRASSAPGRLAPARSAHGRARSARARGARGRTRCCCTTRSSPTPSAACRCSRRPCSPPCAARARPLVTLLHEYAYPWGRAGLRGAVWALTQRAVLIEVVRASTALDVTADFRAERLASRRWLPRRPVVVAPVFSNLPEPARAPGAEPAKGGAGGETRVVGLFGYGAEGTEVELVLDALRLLREPGPRGRAAAARRAGRGLGGGPRLERGAAARAALRARCRSRGCWPRRSWRTRSPPAMCCCSPTPRADLAQDDARRLAGLGQPARGDRRAATLAARSPTPARLRSSRRRPGAGRRARASCSTTAPSATEFGERGRAFAREQMSAERSAQVLDQLLRAIGRPRAAPRRGARVRTWPRPCSRPASPIARLARGVGEQLLSAPASAAASPGVTPSPLTPGSKPVGDPAGLAGDDGPPGGERLDPDEPERLGPDRRQRDDRRFGELARELLDAEPAREADALLDAEPLREPAHRRQAPAVAADDELGVEAARGADQHGDALRRDDAPGEDDAAALLVPRAAAPAPSS